MIRNFAIISHIDHGKSTLADRFLEITNTVIQRKMRSQYLDQMDLEREKGITIKMQPVRMNYTFNSKNYILNLIDTPGHVDFSYEVSRALAAVEGAVLLIDATKGIQAQTLSNLEIAQEQNLNIIPVVNKIDSPQAQIKETKKELAFLLKISEEEILLVSAKQGTNVVQILETIITKIPAPLVEKEDEPLRALIFDSSYDSYKGVIAYVRVVGGKIKVGDVIKVFASQTESEVKEVGCFQPELITKNELLAGEIGYIATGIKEPEKIKIGDTIIILDSQNFKKINPLQGYREPKPMVFASIYPEKADDFKLLKKALSQLKLNDSALSFELELKQTLGQGFRCGFLGLLHIEIIVERIQREFGVNLVLTTPSVIYKYTNQQGQEVFIFSSTDWPSPDKIKNAYEPWIRVEVVAPINYWGKVMEVLKNFEGKHIEINELSSAKVLLIYEMPLREMITGFYDKLKGATKGYASMNYKEIGYQTADLVKLEVLISGERQEVFSKIIPRTKLFSEGQALVKKLKNLLPPQLFSVPIQAVVGGKIIAREDIRAKRKDVLAPLYGGDYSRKKKLLEKQKKGKKKLKARGGIKIPQKVFLEMFK
ncbi:MAG: translation elongation factor 4 [Candidatus Pacebacteria bacterium]|nr:translation elongation factor 4 [Candidatus Paceibacterota bacterium]